MLVEPGHGGADSELDAPEGVGFIGDALALGAAQRLLGLLQDLEEQLLLGGEVPVEDPLAHPDALHDLGNRCRVVALGGEALGGEVHQLASALEPPGGQTALHEVTVRSLD